MGKIISDISKRIIIVKGVEEVERIKHLDRGKSIIQVDQLPNDSYRVIVTYRVGDYMQKS